VSNLPTKFDLLEKIENTGRTYGKDERTDGQCANGDLLRATNYWFGCWCCRKRQHYDWCGKHYHWKDIWTGRYQWTCVRSVFSVFDWYD